MLISESRVLAKNFTRNANSSASYTLTMIDQAVQSAGAEAVRIAVLVPTTSSLTLTLNSDVLPAFPANFRPDRLQEVYLIGSNLQVNNGYLEADARYDTLGAPLYTWATPGTVVLPRVDWTDYKNLQVGQPAVGQPQVIAFNTLTTGNVYPVPDQNYTVVFRWLDLFTPWAAGSPLVTVTMSGDGLSALTVADAGDTDYRGAVPAVTFSGGGGTSAAATAVLAGVGLSGVQVTAIGSGYTSAPTVGFSGGGGTGAAATANLDQGGVVTVTLTSPGSGYTSLPTVAFTSGGGSGAAATAIMPAVKVASFTSLTAGSGYTSAPDVLLAGITVTDKTLNIPTDLMNRIIELGCPGYLQASEPENARTNSQTQQRFNEYLLSIAGLGNLAQDSILCPGRC